MTDRFDAIVVGAGLAGLAATAELTKAGKRVLLLDQEGEQNLGGQAFWSFGGLFFVDSPEQRRMGVKDSRELAMADWFGTAGFDRPEDEWPRRWAQAYVDFACGEKRAWLHSLGMRWFPVVGWAESHATLRQRRRIRRRSATPHRPSPRAGAAAHAGVSHRALRARRHRALTVARIVFVRWPLQLS
ncbi:MAG: FAD-binding protein [Lysobacteraceae bacterium]